MRKILKTMISMLLVVAMLACATIPTYAARKEEYLSELRLVYANSYEDAM